MNSFPPSPISDLNRETRNYLQKIWRQQGKEHPGIFVKRTEFGWSSFVDLLSLVALLLAVIGVRPRSLYPSLGTQCFLTAAGSLCLISSARWLHRQFSSNALGRFDYFDGTWFWEVGAHRV